MESIELISVGKLKNHPDNPRQIRDDKFKKLVESITAFPEMLEKRPLIVTEDLVVLGGNMRLKASIEAGLKKLPCIIAKGWSPEKQKEFMIKDNNSFGEWDWDNLANSWDSKDLDEWGVDVWQPEEAVDYDALEGDEETDLIAEKLNDGVRKGVLIDFSVEEYPEALEVIKKARESGLNSGRILIENLKKLIDASSK